MNRSQPHVARSLNLTSEFRDVFERFLKHYDLKPGHELVPIDDLMAAILAFAPSLPVSKTQLGKALSKRFFKKQVAIFSDGGLTQCYYLNKKLH